jgi:hypothetical protein
MCRPRMAEHQHLKVIFTYYSTVQGANFGRNHLRRTHFSFHCAGCNIAFSEQHQLETHYRDAERCHQTEVQHNEGIDPLQWQSICRLDIKERYRKDLFTGRCRWYDIWKILFPSEAAPPHPCKKKNAFAAFVLSYLQGTK